MKKVLIVLLVIALLFAGAMGGYYWYITSHIFVDEAVYEKKSEVLDLRGTGVSLEHVQSVREQLPECTVYWDVPFQGTTYSNDITSLTITSLTMEDIAQMAHFESLQSVDASACDDYAALEVLRAQWPELTVTYRISIGEQSCEPDVTELTLANGEYDLDILSENLIYLSKLQSIHFPRTELTQEQVEGLKALREGLSVTCTVEVCGEEYTMDTTQLNLSSLAGDQVEAVAAELYRLPNLTAVELMKADGTSDLTLEQVQLLQEAAPGAVFHYEFDFYGYHLTTADEEIHIRNKRIGDDGADEVRRALDVLDNCKRFVLEYVNMSNEVLAQIRDEYRGRTKVVWRVFFGQGSTMTDAEALCAVYNLSNTNCKDLIYCEDMRFMDLGHNGDDGNFLRDVSYVAGMPNLEAIILSSAYVSDLTPFANCKKLKFLELAFCGNITDISPLAGCESLEMLNISFTQVKDLSPLDELPLTHLCAKNYSRNRVSAEEQARVAELHPDCWTEYVGEQPYGPGWRYTEDGKDYLDYYGMLRIIWQYDKYPNNPNHTGWYLKDSITDKAMEPYSDNVKAMCRALLEEGGEA